MTDTEKQLAEKVGFKFIIDGGFLAIRDRREKELWDLLVSTTDRLKRISQAGVGLISAERERQVSQEGWSAEHDDAHDGNQIAMAAACYASPVPLKAKILVNCGCRSAGDCPHVFGKEEWVDAWPWDKEFDKRGKHDRIRQLVIAGALIAAEIDRLNREALLKELTDGH
jgi:hypothetical protein